MPAHESKTLRQAWDENAADWVRWARSPECDHAYWRLNLPALIALLPAPGGLTLDVGCGEGRVARSLKELGHQVVGIDSSPALVAAAREAYIATVPEVERWRRRPGFLHVRAVLGQ